jgi:sugar phosphate isomerase/epimerase
MYAPYDRGNYFKPLNSCDLKIWKRALDGIREVADRAADMGITLALQNHAPVLRPGYEDVLAMLQEVDRSNVKLCLDVPLFSDRQKSEYVAEAVSKCKDHIVYTHYGAWNFKETNGIIEQEPAPFHGGYINYEAFIKGLLQIGYDGYLVSEYCLPMIKNHEVEGVEEIDKATIMGMQYMKKLITNLSVGNSKTFKEATLA